MSLHATPAVVLAAVAVLSACAAPAPEASPTLDPTLAVPAETPGPGTPAPGGAGATAGSPDTVSPASPTPTAPDRDPSPTPTTATPTDAASPAPPRPAPTTPAADGTTAPAGGAEPAPFRTVGETRDPRDDQGLEGPAYTDIAAVTIEDDGDRARIRVTMATAVPGHLDDGEVMGVGVNLLRTDSGESRYQVFADGGPEGWLGYFQTPDGFVAYPGDFTVRDATIEWIIPWSSVESVSAGPFRAFVDWSQERPVLNAAAQDRAPDGGDARYDRR